MKITIPKANEAQLNLQNEYCMQMEDMKEAQTQELHIQCCRTIKLDVVSNTDVPYFSVWGRKNMHYNVCEGYFYSLPNTLYQRINHLPYLSLAHQLYSITSNCENKHQFRNKLYIQRNIPTICFFHEFQFKLTKIQFRKKIQT